MLASPKAKTVGNAMPLTHYCPVQQKKMNF